MALSTPVDSGLQYMTYFVFYGYTQSMNDHSWFINSSEGSFTVLLVYVDDIILTENDKEEIARIRRHSRLKIFSRSTNSNK